jgi:hypothetical protein
MDLGTCDEHEDTNTEVFGPGQDTDKELDPNADDPDKELVVSPINDVFDLLSNVEVAFKEWKELASLKRCDSTKISRRCQAFPYTASKTILGELSRCGYDDWIALTVKSVTHQAVINQTGQFLEYCKASMKLK